jgi:hypothetical protein
MKKKLCVLFFIGVSISINAQIHGHIVGTDNRQTDTLVGAQVFYLKQKSGVSTDTNGYFYIDLPKKYPDTLVFRAIGYFPDTLLLEKSEKSGILVTLYANSLLKEVVVAAHGHTSGILRMQTLGVENLSEGELRKAACCNLSESFSTNASVDVSTTDAVSGARRIELMGLDGVYTQIQMENMPIIRGLGASYGLSSIPGTWIESIQITKGTGNVVNGYEPMAGLINLELKKPMSAEKIYVNAYGNIFGRAELNVQGANDIGKQKKWTTAWFAHGSGLFAEMDKNKDGFRDMPKTKTVSLFNRWDYRGKKSEIQFGIRGIYDNKLGGQVGYTPRNTSGKYGVDIDIQNLNAFLKTGFFLKKRPLGSIGLIYNGKIYQLKAKFGKHHFNGLEKRFYFNSIYSDILGNTLHNINTGLSLVYVNFQQKLDGLNLSREAFVPGAYFEYTYKGEKFSLVAGAREDWHSLFGFQFSPRLHLKWSIGKTTDFRATAGRAWRIPNYMSDNLSLLATSRTWVYTAQLKPEISWNMGGSWVQRMKLFGRTASITIDYFHTLFTQQLIVDRSNAYLIQFHNLNGRSFSNAAQAEFVMEPIKMFEVRLAYKFLDVRSIYGGKFQQQVMIPKHRALVNLNYETRNRRWKFDLTGAFIGEQRLPGSTLIDAPTKSKAYATLNAQITMVYKKWEFYIGGENLLNYRQKNAILDAANPFGASFDATQVWAPIAGINVYMGFRFIIERKKTE